MKATDLMVGDWVLAYGKKTQIVWVGNIHKMAVRGFPYEFMDGEIEPIPLTPEILEKNGFVNFVVSQYTLPNCSAGVILTKIEEMPNTNGKWLVAIKKGYTDVKIDITYVHELQHAFKLCGINKEITL